MATMTEKQADYLSSLKQTLPSRLAPSMSAGTAMTAKALLQTALLLALPTPETALEASAQIDACKSADFRAVAQAHPDWYKAVVTRIQHIDPMSIATTTAEGWAFTGSSWLAYIQSRLEA